MRDAMKKYGRPIAMMVLLFFAQGATLFAQPGEITGTITDLTSDEGLIGATVVVKGTTNGTMSGIDGHYAILASPNDTLLVSFIGYMSEQVFVSDQTEINVGLIAELTELTEIVVVGYGTQKKIELTGAVSSVKSKDMVNVVASDFTKALQGQVAGVSVVESSGRPGDQANIQIRGLGSISSSTSPLYVVDGIPYAGNPNIPSEDIARIEVLKDGAAAAVYGTRASNGVILITTKRGKAGETKVSLTAYYGIQDITSGTPLLNTDEHLYVEEMMYQAVGEHSPTLHYNPDAGNYNTDWVSYVLKDNAPLQNYNLSFSGGQENMTFNVNTNYYNQDGILINSGYERFSTRANVSFKKDKFDAFVSIGVSQSDQDVEPWAVYEYSVWQGPFRPPLEDMDQTENTINIPGGNPDHLGYFAQQLGNTDNRKERSYNLAANLKYEIFKGLRFQMNIGTNSWSFNRKYWQPQFLVYQEDGELNVSGSREDARLLESFISSQKLTLENLLIYDKSFGDHSLSLVAGYTIEYGQYKLVAMEKTNFISNDIQVFDGGSELTSTSGYNTINALTGKLFRVQYNYKDRYLFSGSLRYDGSSKFGPENRYALFPGVSAGWNISEEGFMKNVSQIDNLKLRASYAEVGNEGIPPYLYSGFIDANIDYVWGPETGDFLDLGAIQRGYANPDIRWESNLTRNIGIDLTMFDGKFGGNIDLYKNNKKDMLLDVLLPASLGVNVPNDWGTYNSKTMNVGNMVNEGLEVQAYYKYRSTSGLAFQLTGVFTKNKNTITDLGEMEDVPLSDSKPSQWRAYQQDVTTYLRPGYEAGAFFLIPTNGIIKTEEQLTAVQEYMPNAQLGDLIYIDVNEDGQINDDDRQYSGSGMPDFEAGLKMDGSYNGFDLSLHFFYSHGNMVYNGSKLFAYAFSRHKDMYYMWTPANPESDIMMARSSSEHDNFRSRSDYWLEDGSFLRLRTAILGYTIPKELFKGHIENIRVYASAQNLFTLTDYEGFDPEIGGSYNPRGLAATNAGSGGRSMANRGIDKGNYPVSRKFIFGVQIDF